MCPAAMDTVMALHQDKMTLRSDIIVTGHERKLRWQIRRLDDMQAQQSTICCHNMDY